MHAQSVRPSTNLHGPGYRRGVIDTHCHLVFPDFRDRVDAVLAEAAKAGVSGVITISTSSHDAPLGLELARAHKRVWCTAGVHPLYSDRGPHEWGLLRLIAQDPKCVAWGELGLDRHYDRPPWATQVEVLTEQLAFIEGCQREGLTLPVVIHCREAFDDLIPMLRSSSLDPSRFVFHCFTGSVDDARKVLDFGAMLSFTGVLTYRNAPDVQEAGRMAPADRILVETDAPYLSPEPKRGVRPCTPAFARLTAEKLAEIRGVSFEALELQLDANTERFFGIDVHGEQS